MNILLSARVTLAGLTAVVLCLPVSSHAWGPEIHQVVGQLAQEQLTPAARESLHQIMSSSDSDVIAAACNWPDDFRATPEGNWSRPQHYINVPRSEAGFEPARDCKDDLCVAGAIGRYAAELGNANADPETRWQAWARVCHFVGDIHQPLHVGYVYDRGGNDTEVIYQGEEMGLHYFWDHALLEENYPEWQLLTPDLIARMDAPLPANWQAKEADVWARESHRLVRQTGYPPQAEITPEFAAASWLLALDRIELAGRRLARILNTVLTETD